MPRLSLRARLLGAAIAVSSVGGAYVIAQPLLISHAAASDAAAKAPPATPVSVAVVESREVTPFEEFSGRLEAVERVEVRARVAGQIQTVHFREGELVKAGDLLVTIDPAPYAAEVDRLKAQLSAAQARVALTKNDLERGQRLFETKISVSQRVLDERENASSEADANYAAAQAALKAAQLNLDYTQVRAPVSGRVGKLEITTGNLVASGATAPLLTTLVSVDPIYASFSADEHVVLKALKALGGGTLAQTQVARIPVDILTAVDGAATRHGKLQLIDNQIDAKSGTVRVRAVFDNPDGELIPGQFVRVRMGQPTAEPTLLVSERAIGTDQNKKYVLVVDADNKAIYREVTLGGALGGLRVVTAGLKTGERIVVNGLQKLRPGAVVAPEVVPMTVAANDPAKGEPAVAQR